MFRKLFTVLLTVALVAAGTCAWWITSPIAFDGETLDVELESGMSARSAAQLVTAAGARVSPQLLYAWFRASGKARQIRAGSYEFDQGVTPFQMLADLTAGKEALRRVTLVEGWTFRQVRAALNAHQAIRHDTANWDDSDVMIRLGRPGVHPEGRFFPDTYTFGKNSSDLKILGRALKSMESRLSRTWATRKQADTPLQSPDQALILASIVEKETGSPSDRGRIAGVFTNRLRIGMLLQTDPTVIYGMGERYQGKLRKVDLQTDTPYNTYTRAGLPPTPIAMPSQASLDAAINPESTRAVYFVARGDGSSQFSDTLEEHNRAVAKFILKRH